ncbi:hypothetical protein GA0115256_12817 [Streptomyces sp. DconLS]|nr:hypothetical protein GA0115256_12817 [Streptomyces sp. DconLS]
MSGFGGLGGLGGFRGDVRGGGRLLGGAGDRALGLGDRGMRRGVRRTVAALLSATTATRGRRLDGTGAAPVPTPLSPRPLVSKSSMPGRCGPSPSKGSFGRCRSGSDGRWMSGVWTSVCSPPPNLRLPPPPPIAPMMPEVSAEPMSFSPPKISDITSVVTMLDAPPMRPLPISEDANFGAKAEPAPEKIPPIAPPIAPPSRAWSVAAVSHLVRSPLRNWIPWITASMPTMNPTPVAIEISSRFSSILTIARTPVTRTGIASGAQKASSAISTASHTSWAMIMYLAYSTCNPVFRPSSPNCPAASAMSGILDFNCWVKAVNSSATWPPTLCSTPLVAGSISRLMAVSWRAASSHAAPRLRSLSSSPLGQSCPTASLATQSSSGGSSMLMTWCSSPVSRWAGPRWCATAGSPRRSGPPCVRD